MKRQGAHLMQEVPSLVGCLQRWDFYTCRDMQQEVWGLVWLFFQMSWIWLKDAIILSSFPGLALRSRVLVIGSKEAEEEEEAEAEEEAEQNHEIVFRLLIDTQGWGEMIWKVVQGVTQVGVAH